MKELQCEKKVCQDISDEYGTNYVWSKYEIYLDDIMRDVETCSEHEDNDLIQECFLKKAMSGERIFRIFYMHLIDFNKQGAISLRTKYYNDCDKKIIELASELFNHMNIADDSISGAQLECIWAAIDHVMADNGREHDWAGYLFELIEHSAKSTACSEIEDAAENEACEARETRSALEILHRLMKNENGSSALRDEIRNQIATDCVTEAGRHTSSHATDL